jgi:hypothetical protein
VAGGCFDSRQTKTIPPTCAAACEQHPNVRQTVLMAKNVALATTRAVKPASDVTVTSRCIGSGPAEPGSIRKALAAYRRIRQEFERRIQSSQTPPMQSSGSQQVPPQQAKPGGHTFPQAPQLFTSANRIAQESPQQVCRTDPQHASPQHSEGQQPFPQQYQLGGQHSSSQQVVATHRSEGPHSAFDEHVIASSHWPPRQQTVLLSTSAPQRQTMPPTPPSRVLPDAVFERGAAVPVAIVAPRLACANALAWKPSIEIQQQTTPHETKRTTSLFKCTFDMTPQLYFNYA